MEQLFPFITPACGLFWSVVGVWGIVASYRSGRQDRLAADVQSEPSNSAKAEASRRLARKRLGSAFWLSVGIATLCFSGIRIGTPPAAAWPPQEESSRLAEIVTQHVERDFAQKSRVGLVVGAIAKDKQVLLGFGKCWLGDSQPPDADTVFEIGSITKVFTGILLAKRIENGQLELDDRIVDLLPEGWSLSESARGITLRHCTTHTSGLPRLPGNLMGVSNLARGLFGGDPYRNYSENQFRDALETVELEFEPGTERRYSNFAVGLLGFVLAEQSGSDYETLVEDEICRPLGMRRTVIGRDKSHAQDMPAKYRGTLKLGPTQIGLESEDWQLPNHLAGAGGIRSTGGDMMTFLKANMGRIPADFDAAMRRSHQELYKERATKAVGMNWIRSFEKDISQSIIYHNGGTGGFRTYLGFTEDRQVGVFAMSNTAVSVDGMAEGIIKALVFSSPIRSNAGDISALRSLSVKNVETEGVEVRQIHEC